MGKFNLDDYETVDSRLKRFWADHPSASIRTEMITSISSIEDHIMFTAIISERINVGEGSYMTRPLANGHAYEKKGEGYINKTSWVENCETSAIGRALANLGYSGDKRASREEMNKVNKANYALAESEKKELINKMQKLDPETIDLDTVLTFGKYDGNPVGDLLDDSEFELYIADCLSKSLQKKNEYWSKVFSKIGDLINAKKGNNELDQALKQI